MMGSVARFDKIMKEDWTRQSNDYCLHKRSAFIYLEKFKLSKFVSTLHQIVRKPNQRNRTKNKLLNKINRMIQLVRLQPDDDDDDDVYFVPISN